MQIQSIKTNQNNKAQAFGMRIKIDTINHLSMLDRYALYKMNQELAPKKGPTIKAFCLKNFFRKNGEKPQAFLYGKTGIRRAHIGNTIKYDCPDYDITQNDLRELVKKIEENRSKFGKWFDRFRPKSEQPEPRDFGLTDDEVLFGELNADFK